MEEMLHIWEQLAPLLRKADISVTRWALLVGQMELGSDPCFEGVWDHLTLPLFSRTTTGISLILVASPSLAKVLSLAGKKKI